MNRITTFKEYLQEYKKSVQDPEGFWAGHAEGFVWRKKWDSVLEWNFEDPDVRWFAGGKLNITENCLDRHLAERAQQPAIVWEPNNPEEEGRSFSYQELHEEVCRFANILKNNGARRGDRICLYMPMVPELAFAVLACARIGAIHSVVFGGFSFQSLSGRIQDADCTMVVTADGAFRGAKEIPLKPIVDEALLTCPTVKKVLVLRRTGSKINMTSGRDIWLHDEREKAGIICEVEVMDAEDMLFILYTSGSTGKPKGVVHTTGGYMVYADYTFRNVFQYQSGEVFWCTADIGWITGHTYLVYGPLLAGATTLMFEGIPSYPDSGRFWKVIDKHQVNIFYTAPTAIRSLMACGSDFVKPYRLDSLRVLGTVGEPINEEAWHWYHELIGKKKCPVVDTWWQTETGGILISPLAGITPSKPSYATLPLPGIQPAILDEHGVELTGESPDGERKAVEGRLCLKFPWPSIIRTTYNSHERCRESYFSQFKGYYFTGDGCKRDENGYYRITGRVDDVIKVSGHLLGTAEIENAIDEHPDIVESAVVGFPHAIKGWGIYAFVIAEHARADTENLKKEISETVCKFMGSIARPDKIQVVKGLPKTRSGKIMRRILRKIAEGDSSDLGDISTLLDPAVVAEIKTGAIR